MTKLLRRQPIGSFRLRKPPIPKATVIKRPDYYGSANPDVMFVADPIVARPDADEPPQTTLPIPGNQIKFLTELCEKHGVSIKKACIVRACPPVLADTWNSDKQMGDHIKLNRDEFIANVANAKPSVIVAMGKSSARQVANRSVKIMTVRGTPTQNEEFGCLVLPTVGLGHAIRIPEVQPLLDVDMATLTHVIEAGFSLDYQVDNGTDYRWTTDLKFLLDLADEGRLDLAVDCETLGLRYYDPNFRVLCAQITWEAGKGIAVPIDYNPNYLGPREQKLKYTKAETPKIRKSVVRQLKALLEHPNVHCFGQNFKFDYLAFKFALDITVANFEDDTICLAHGVDENMYNKGLDELTRRFAPELAGYADALNRDPVHLGKSRMDLVHPDQMLNYGVGDTDACWRVKQTLEAKLQQDKKAYRHYKFVVMPALRAFATIEDHGFCIDKPALKAFEIMLRKHQHEEYNRIRAMVPFAIANVELDDAKFGKWDRRDRKNPKLLKRASITRPGFLRSMLFTHRQGLRITPIVFTKSTKAKKDPRDRVPSTSGKQHIAYFEDEHIFIKPIMEFIQNEKLLGTYVGSDGEDDEDGSGSISGFYRYLFDGRIRPTYLLHRAVTGRTASADPNGQNFPKRGKLAKKYREIFIAPPGYVLLEVDFSQIELRIAAIMANDPTMLKLYREGADIHAATAAGVMGLTLEQFANLPKDVRDLKRFQAKAIAFGFLYGMGWRKFITYARTEYKITFNDEEAQEIRNTFFRLYRRLKPWHNGVREYVAEKGSVRTLTGRLRHLPSVFSPDDAIREGAMRMAINSPVQGTGSDLGLCALALLVKNVSFDLVRPIGFIHDALVCLAPEDKAIEAAQIIKYWMEHIPTKTLFNWEPVIPIIAEASVGKNLSKTIEINDKWYNNDNVSNWMDIQRVDWQARCKVAEARGEPRPERPWAPKLRNTGIRKKLVHLRKTRILPIARAVQPVRVIRKLKVR